VQNIDWPYPGARWWKFDFHTHTPASWRDTDAWQQAVGTPEEVTPKKWLLQYMAAGIDCVAVTDHNSGAWIDRLKDAYAQMQAQADRGNAPAGFRPLTIFPGVEISANGGIHVLAIFDPSFTTSDIDSLLDAVEYEGTKGDSDGETRKSVAEVIAKIIERGGIAIPAHADSPKGLLRVNPGTRQCALSAHTVRQALEVEGLLAVEWCDPTNPYPEAVDRLAAPLARVLGSDCHNFRGNKTPGSAYTWVKMAQPTLEGLRLALLDGNGVSIRRSDDTEAFDPFQTPTHLIRAIEIEKARVMGHHQPARLDLSPHFNAIVGGRGTGKSTIVHVLRLATRREDELPVGSEPRERFEAFRQIAKRRDDQGALRAETTIRVEWHIEYRRDKDWYPISQGSQGQRSVALLAFLLAFGDEPIVLDQPEDDLDNHLIYDLIVRQIRENKLRRQLIIVTHNPNVVVNGDAELVHVMDFGAGQCYVKRSGALQEKTVREEVCRVMEGGREAFARRWKRLGQEV
jgi:ABC-type lipoprotein export system ATPase subunit